MWKLAIADDEPRIRRGLTQVLPWEELGIELVGEAEDGIEALELAKAAKPDLMFVDINMPFLDGLSFIERVQSEHPCLIIVITGHDEFKYAQQAVKLQVFDYILKPVSKSHLKETVDKALQTLEDHKFKEEHRSWANNQLQSNSLLIRDTFLRKWVHGLTTPEEAARNIEFLQLPITPATRMSLVKVVQSTDIGAAKREWSKELLEFASKNVIEDVLGNKETNIVFHDEKGQIVILGPDMPECDWFELYERMQSQIERILGKIAVCAGKVIGEDDRAADGTYRELLQEIAVKGSYSPVVMLAKKVMEQAYAMPNLTLQDVADQVRVSPAYLSKLLKKEVGLSFIDYLTKMRIQRAMLFMNDPGYKVYEIAEKVGYNSQHYFSNAFKKITGISPMSYRKGNRT